MDMFSCKESQNVWKCKALQEQPIIGFTASSGKGGIERWGVPTMDGAAT